MANADNPHGLQPINTTHGGAFFTEEFSKVVGYGTALFLFDAVARVADGSIEKPATPGTTAISGVNMTYAAASTASTHLVITDPSVIFDCQDNNDTDGIAAADLGLNANLEYNAGSATTKISGHEIDESTADTTNTLDVHLLRLRALPNNAHGANARIEILINRHRLHSLIAGV